MQSFQVFLASVFQLGHAVQQLAPLVETWEPLAVNLLVQQYHDCVQFTCKHVVHWSHFLSAQVWLGTVPEDFVFEYGEHHGFHLCECLVDCHLAVCLVFRILAEAIHYLEFLDFRADRLNVFGDPDTHHIHFLAVVLDAKARGTFVKSIAKVFDNGH